MFRPVLLGLLICLLPLPVWAADSPKPDPKAKPKEAGRIDPKQFKTVCDTADVIVVGKAYAILTATLDSEPPTPVYTSAKLESKGLKFLKGREKLGSKATTSVTDAFDELAQPAETLMDKPVLAAFKWDGKSLKLMMLSELHPADAAMIAEKYPEAK